MLHASYVSKQGRRGALTNVFQQTCTSACGCKLASLDALLVAEFVLRVVPGLMANGGDATHLVLRAFVQHLKTLV